MSRSGRSEVPRKAVILSAGRGERLRPLTDRIPKVMVPIAGSPLLEHHIRRLKEFGVTEIFLNPFYKKEVITEYFGDGKRCGMKIRYVEMDQLYDPPVMLRKYLRRELDEPFLVIYGDCFSLVDYAKFYQFHRRHRALATTVAQRSTHPEAADLLELDPDGRVRKIWLKPHEQQPKTDVSFAGVLAFQPDIFDYFPARDELRDRSFQEVYGRLHQANARFYAYLTDELLEDIGTLERLELVSARVAALERVA